MKAKIACTAIAGFIIGIAIEMKVLNSPQPSIREASTISSGNDDFMYDLMKYTTPGAAIEGIIRGQYVFVSLRSDMNAMNPADVTCIGTIITRRITV